MTISNDLIKHLRELTGSSIILCKKVLEETGGDLDKALALLKKSDEALASKKTARTTGAGIIDSYIHGTKKVGVLLELRCETDFVARNPEFQALAHDISLHIAGMKPAYVSKDKIPEEAREEAKRLFEVEAENLGKTPEMTIKIVEGKLDAHFEDVSLLSQPFVKDNTVTVDELIKRHVARFGEKIEIEKFVRYEI